MDKSKFSIVITEEVFNIYFKDFYITFNFDMDLYLVSKDKSIYNDYPNIHFFSNFNSIIDLDLDRDTIYFLCLNDLDSIKNTNIKNNPNLILIKSENLENKELIKEKINHMNDLINISIESNSDFIENLLLFNIYHIIELNYSEFTNLEYKEIISSITKILTYISKDRIFKSNYLNKDIKSFLIFLKNNQEYNLEFKKNNVLLYTEDYLIDDLASENIKIDFLDLKEGVLNIDGYLKSNFYYDSLDFEAILESKDKNNKKIYKAKFLEYPLTDRRTYKYFGIKWLFYYNFNIRLVLDEIEDYKIILKTVFTESDYKILIKNNISFRKHANLSHYTNYTCPDSKIIEFNNNKFFIQDYSTKNLLKLEFKSLLKIIKSKKPFWYKALLMRILYLILKPFYKNKKIFLFEDRPLQADDNGEILFKYAMSQKDNIDKYFIIDKNTSDYKRLSKDYKNIISFKSLKHKILYLFADKHFSSHIDRVFLDPFNDESPEFYNSLIKFRRYFIQHGVIQSDLSHWIRRYYHNLDLFLTSSSYERDSIIKGYYHYDKDIVQLLGLPRYDFLENKDNLNKDILFMPTWRKYLNTKEEFLNSDYYKRLNRFFNNEKLKDYLLRYGYKIVFKPHYNISQYLNYLDIDDEYVRLAEESYRELFNSSSLLITDYSSVFFDFAYLKKPIIYYHEKDEYHFNKGYFDYDTMGFGEVIQDEDKLVDLIILYMENDCKMDEKYKKRVDNFFKYNDKNNSKRVYNWSLKEK